MAQGPFTRAIQRVADYLGALAPAQRALRFIEPFTVRDIPETQAGSTLRGAAGSGEVTGYTEIGLDTSKLPGIVTSRIILGTYPMRINGGASDDLAAVNITVSIDPATPLAPGSLSAADKAKLDSVSVGASIADVLGVAPIVVTGTSTKTVSISPAGPANAGSLSSTFYNLLANILTPSTPTTIVPDAPADTGTQNFAARTDHQHAIDTAVAGAIAIGDSAAEGVSTSFARADHRHSLAAPAAPTVIQPDASAATGVSTAPARADHTHGIVAATAGAIAVGDAATEGASTSFARADHVHALAAPGTPASVGAANSAGVSIKIAREDHVHASASQRELGANTLTGTTTTRYLTTGYNSGTASSNPLDMPVVKAFKIDSLRMFARLGGTAGQTITATIRKNGAGVGTAVLTTASDATSGSSSFTAVGFSPGDTWGLQIDKSGAIATSPTDIFWSAGTTPP